MKEKHLKTKLMTMEKRNFSLIHFQCMLEHECCSPNINKITVGERPKVLWKVRFDLTHLEFEVRKHGE
jgi:hypothetical protein